MHELTHKKTKKKKKKESMDTKIIWNEISKNIATIPTRMKITWSLGWLEKVWKWKIHNMDKSWEQLVGLLNSNTFPIEVTSCVKGNFKCHWGGLHSHKLCDMRSIVRQNVWCML